MKLPKEYLKIKTSLLKEFSKLQQQQKLTTIKRVVNLPSLNKLTGIKDLRKKLNSPDKKKGGAELKHKPEVLSRNRLSWCITPPYTLGMGSVGFGHPISLFTGEEIEVVYNPFSSVDYITGEISLSVISGQNFADFYSAGSEFHFSDEYLAYYRPQCGQMHQLITLPVAYDSETLVEINVNADLPDSGVLDLKPGDLSSNLYGLVGAEGFLDVFVTYGQGAGFTTAGYSSNNFLIAWKTADSPVNSFYQSNPTCTHSFILPAGVTQFWININTHINAYSANKYNPRDLIQREEYSLIDFRASSFENEFQIFRHFFTNHDHVAPGPIKIKSICLSIEPYYIKVLDHHWTD